MPKKIVISLLVIMVLLSCTATVFAEPPGMSTMQGITDISHGNRELTNMGNQIIGIVYAVGIAVAIGILMILGIKYMMASPEDKANIKSTAIPYLIGAILTFGAVNIMKIVADMAEWVK